MSSSVASRPLDVVLVPARLGFICLAAGILGAASGLLLAAIPPAVDPDRFSYPLSATAFVAVQAWFVVQHVGLLAGVAGLERSGALDRSKVGEAGYIVAMAGLLTLTATEVAAMFAADFDYEGTYTMVLDAAYGLSSTAAGAGLVLAGIVFARSRTWTGALRFVPLATGIFVFVPMFPAMMAGFTAARFGISGWMAMFALLGWGLMRQQRP